MTTKLKKVTLPFFAGFISMQMPILFGVGLVAGYIVAAYFSEKVCSFEIPVGRYKIHLHHWIMALIGLVIVILTGTYRLFPSFVLGLGTGFIFQGIYCYTDWHHILKRKE